jgi:deoxyhypusine synthase
MIRRGKVHAISTTGANLEEDLFNLVAREHYVRVPGYRHLTPFEEQKLYLRRLNRVTDTCIPEERAAVPVYEVFRQELAAAARAGLRPFPHEVLYTMLREGRLRERYSADPADSWVLAAAERDLPLFVPGWADSTLGNMFTASCLKGELPGHDCIRHGTEYLAGLTGWYRRAAASGPVGFFQIGGGIAGDFAVCVVPMLRRSLDEDLPAWSYFCQISDSVTSYGSYSGAVPNEKITWGKLDADTPRFIVESDATIVAPLVFALVLGL